MSKIIIQLAWPMLIDYLSSLYLPIILPCSILERARKSGETGAVALGMLRDEWTTLQTELDSKTRELENAYELITRQEDEMNKTKGRVNGFKKQIEELKARPPTVIVKEVPASPQQIKTEEVSVLRLSWPTS